jgi:hypothetical protein
MAWLKQRGDARRYWVKDAQCISAECLALGLYQPRGAIGAAPAVAAQAQYRQCACATLITAALGKLAIRRSWPHDDARKV